MILLLVFGIFGFPTLHAAKKVLTRMSGHAVRFGGKAVDITGHLLIEKGHLGDAITVGKLGKKAWDGPPQGKPRIQRFSNHAWRPTTRKSIEPITPKFRSVVPHPIMRNRPIGIKAI